MSLAKRIDAIVGDYYDFKSTDGYFDENGVGKFFEWVDDNGYDTEMIEDELKGDATDCSMLEFADDFPSHLDNEDHKQEFMFQLLKLGIKQPTDSNWERVTGAYQIFKYKAKLVHISPTQFGVVGPEDVIDETYGIKDKRHYMHQIYIYNVIKKEWTFLVGYDSWTSAHGSLGYNSVNGQFWLINSSKIQLVDPKYPRKVEEYPCQDHASKFITQVNPIEDEKEMRRAAKYKYWGSNAAFEWPKKKMHFMGGRSNACHVKFVNKQKLGELKWDVSFPNLGWERGNTGLAVFYVHTQKRLLTLGGNKWPDPERPNEFHDEIWQQYPMEGKNWRKLKLTMPKPMADFGYAMDWNERYIVVSHVQHGIYRLDLESMEWSERSKVDPPTDEEHGISICGAKGDRNNKLLTYGYIRTLYKFIGIKVDFPSSKIINKMIDYVEEMEYVHSVDLRYGGHWRHSFRELFDE